MSIKLIHTALVLTCGHVVRGAEWFMGDGGSQVRAYCYEHRSYRDVVGREVL